MKLTVTDTRLQQGQGGEGTAEESNALTVNALLRSHTRSGVLSQVSRTLETRDVRPGIRRSGPGRSAVAQCAVRQRLCSVRSAWGLRCLYLRCVPVRRWGPRAAVKAV